MTAEISILNRSAVALAADSAVTISQKKVYNSVNKLFMLSKFHPVGVMIYGSAEVMGVPWETIIKSYREDLSDRPFESLQEYYSDFLRYLKSSQDFFPSSQQKNLVLSSAYSLFREIKTKLTERVQEKLALGQTLTDSDIPGLVEEVIVAYDNNWNAYKLLPEVDDFYFVTFANEYSEQLEKAQNEVLEKLPLTATSIERLRRTVANWFARDTLGNATGIVVAGFGEKEIFPHMRSCMVGGKVNNTLRYKDDRTADITFESGASINPFAQSEMVLTFATGIDPDYNQVLDGAFREGAARMSDFLMNNLQVSVGQLPGIDWNGLAELASAERAKIVNEIEARLNKFRWENYTGPIFDTVASLPAVDLAAMAESLVNLTSFKRRVSMNIETVGGPIDVALITKGDGFVWIKRKHYFEPSLNQGFFANYYRRPTDNETNGR